MVQNPLRGHQSEIVAGGIAVLCIGLRWSPLLPSPQTTAEGEPWSCCISSRQIMAYVP